MTTATPKTPTLRQMVTEFPDGIVIGWDWCSIANGGCNNHISTCVCKGGPKEPKVFAAWREQAAWPGSKSLLPQITSPSKNPTPDKPAIKPAAERRAEAGLGDMPGRPSTDDTVKCVTCEDDVPVTEADENDDKTWSCHACQEAGIQRGVKAE